MFNTSQFLRAAGSRLLVAALFSAVTGAASAAVINVSSASSSLSVGQNFSVNFSISGLTGALNDSLSGFDIDIHFNPAAMQLTGFGFTDPASGQNQLDLPEAGAFPFLGDALVSGNLIDAFGLSGNSAAVLDAGQADSFTFLVLNFKAIAASQLSTIEIDLLDPSLLFINSEADTLDTTIGASGVRFAIGDAGTPLPEPGALALFAAGAAALAAMRRRARARAGRGAATLAAAAVVALGLTGALPASAQTQPAAAGKAATAPQPVQAAAAPETAGSIDGVIVAVEGQRLQLRLAGGATRWVTVDTAPSKSQVGKKVSGTSVARGDTFLLTNPKFAD